MTDHQNYMHPLHCLQYMEGCGKPRTDPTAWKWVPVYVSDKFAKLMGAPNQVGGSWQYMPRAGRSTQSRRGLGVGGAGYGWGAPKLVGGSWQYMPCAEHSTLPCKGLKCPGQGLFLTSKPPGKGQSSIAHSLPGSKGWERLCGLGDGVPVHARHAQHPATAHHTAPLPSPPPSTTLRPLPKQATTNPPMA